MEDDPLLSEDIAVLDNNPDFKNEQKRREEEIQIINQNRRLQVRINAARNVGDTYSSPSAILLLVPLIFYLPQVIGVFIILPQHWNIKDGVCDRMLQIWVLVHAIRILLILLCWFSVYSRRIYVIYYTIKLDRFLTLFGVVWFILGNVWFYHIDPSPPSTSSSPPISCNTPIYSLTRILLICSYIPFLLPCVIFILLIPIVWCCLPTVIRFLQFMAQKERGADDKLLDGLPVSKFQRSSFEDPDVTCAICLVPYNEGDPIRTLPCPGSQRKPHVFHQSCVDTWLKTNATCPLCRFNLKRPAPRNDPAMIV